jgi:hypothetical protein
VTGSSSGGVYLSIRIEAATIVNGRNVPTLTGTQETESINKQKKNLFAILFWSRKLGNE